MGRGAGKNQSSAAVASRTRPATSQAIGPTTTNSCPVCGGQTRMAVPSIIKALFGNKIYTRCVDCEALLWSWSGD